MYKQPKITWYKKGLKYLILRIFWGFFSIETFYLEGTVSHFIAAHTLKDLVQMASLDTLGEDIFHPWASLKSYLKLTVNFCLKWPLLTSAS